MSQSSSWPANQPGSAGDDPNRAARLAASDREAGFEITADFEPFHQRDDMFNRAFWDPAVMSDDVMAFFKGFDEPKPRKADGFSQWDFALSNAAWSVAHDYAARGNPHGKREGFLDPFAPYLPIAPAQVDVSDPADVTQRLRKVARFLGADLVGFAEYDPRWTYATAADFGDKDRGEKIVDLPDGLCSVIVLGHGMDHGLVKRYPSSTGGAATGREYSREAAIVSSMASFIRALGFEAVATSNDTALTIPYAIKAGLGEYGRNQMVITPEYGPRVRFSKVLTTLPVAYDRPRKFGVTEFCSICQKCADACPPRALPFGPPTDEPLNRSTIRGVKKWSADCEKCFKFWTKMRTDCAICMRVCPYNMDYAGRVARVIRWLMGTRLRRIMLWLNSKTKQGERQAPKDWWDGA